VDYDPAAIILMAAKSPDLLPAPVGILLLAAAVVVVISTGMNYLLSPSTNLIRDIYQTFINKNADQKKLVAMQKILIVVIGLFAFLMIFIPTVLEMKISVLKYAYTAYTLYGVAITPALLAALAWKRATKQAGVWSIVLGSLVVIFLDIVVVYGFPELLINDDPWGIPSIYPGLLVSIGTLVIVSYLTPKPSRETLIKLFPDMK
jgi:Na+/proline symporter